MSTFASLVTTRRLLAAAALLALGACGGGRLEGADTTGNIPNAAGAGAPQNYDTAASPGGRDSTLGKADVNAPRTGSPTGDTLAQRPRP